jgi:hypothetical protein
MSVTTERYRNSRECRERVRNRVLGLDRRPHALDAAILVHEERRADQADRGPPPDLSLAPILMVEWSVREQRNLISYLVSGELLVGQVREIPTTSAPIPIVPPMVAQIARLFRAPTSASG